MIISSSDAEPKLLAFHLPQYHPIPENNEWWGAGFTEWMNVTKGLPLFKGHQQPHMPADLGFYDLRVPETREHQADLARVAGISGFVYYHYWFHGRRLLDRPVNEILASGNPDFPFCLCWANEPWSRNWDGQNKLVLMSQEYSDEDDRTHIAWLLMAFADPRYISIDGKPLLLVYRPSSLTDCRRTFEHWRNEARRHGFKDLFICAVRAFPGEFCDPALLGADASVEFNPNGADCGPTLQSDDPLDIGYRLHRVWEYSALVRASQRVSRPEYTFFPSVCPSWDNSVRRKRDAVIFHNATPDAYSKWLEATLVRETIHTQNPKLVFINAWNEWAEGNHLEPCQRWGHGYIEATSRALKRAHERTDTSIAQPGRRVVPDPLPIEGHVDVVVEETAAVSAGGWHHFTDTGDFPTIIAGAMQLPGGECEILGVAQRISLPRPDVAAALNDDRLLNSGWHGSFPNPKRISRESFRLLAFHKESGRWTNLSISEGVLKGNAGTH